jgi:hypothetical protein
VQEVLHPHAGAHLDEHLRAAHAPGLLADRKSVIEAEAAVGEPLEHHQDGHQFAHRGRRQLQVGILGIEFLARLQIDQKRRVRRRLESRGADWEPAAEQHGEQAQHGGV